MIYSEARAISDEVRGKHNDGARAGKMTYPFGLICWAPVVNLCRDRKLFVLSAKTVSSKCVMFTSARWGRCQEGYGEDPFLQAEISAQYVRGLQYGPDPNHLEAVVSLSRDAC